MFGLQSANILTGSVFIEIVTFIFTLTIIFISIVVFFENENPSKTIAWLLILIVFPVIGFFLYLFIGRKFKKIKRYRQKGLESQAELSKVIHQETKTIERGQDYIANNLPHKQKLINLIANTASSPFTINNTTKIFTDGSKTFASFFEAIEQAQHHIHLEFYIVRNDTIGKKIQESLIKKAQSGVQVRLIYDGMGSRKLDKTFIQKLEDNGVHTTCFSPIVLPLISNRVNYRNHRKILIVDGQIGFLGGINIGDEYLGNSPQFTGWRDTHLKITGEAVKFLQYIFLQDWHFNTKEKVTGAGYYPRCEQVTEQALIQIAAGGPDSPWESIMHMYFSMIATAEKTIYLTTPYFIPNESILMAIKNAALSGVDVRLILPGKPDKRYVLWASMSYLKDLLEAGVRVYQYQKGFIHSKTLVIDTAVSSIGSANMDLRSFNLNFEVNAFIYNEKISQKLEQDFFTDILNSKEITYQHYIQRPLSMKFLESLARLFSPLL